MTIRIPNVKAVEENAGLLRPPFWSIYRHVVIPAGVPPGMWASNLTFGKYPSHEAAMRAALRSEDGTAAGAIRRSIGEGTVSYWVVLRVRGKEGVR